MREVESLKRWKARVTLFRVYIELIVQSGSVALAGDLAAVSLEFPIRLSLDGVWEVGKATLELSFWELVQLT